MKYKINIAPNGVAVDRITAREARRAALFMALIAFVIAGVAIGYLYSIDLETTESDIPFVAAGFGILFGVGCLIYTVFAARLLRPLPERVFFNNERALVEISHQASGARKIEIPYSHIINIDSRMVSHWDSTSKKYSKRYAVTLYLKDGSSWDLMEPSIIEMSYASDFAEKITSSISLNNPIAGNVIQPKLDTPKLSIVHRGDETQIRWRNNNPANASRRLGIPILIMVVASVMSLMAEGDEWIALGDNLAANVNGVSDLAKIPGLMGGLIITAGIISICLIVLLAQVILMFRYRMKVNNITINKTLITSEGSDVSIPIRSAGTVSMTYQIGQGSRTVEILRQATSFKKSESTTFEGELNFKTAVSMMGKTFKEGVKQAVAETFAGSDEPSNVLAEFSFDRFSPIDVYVVKESIRQKLGTLNS